MEYEGTIYGSGATIEKLDAHKKYADAFTTALKNQPSKDERFTLHYVDAFAGRGEVRLPGGAQDVPGSALQALDTVNRRFDRLLLIDRDSANCARLEEMIAERGDGSRAQVESGDANIELPKFCSSLRGPEGRMHRAFVFIDPYAMQVSWETIAAIGATKRADMLMLFPLMAVRRNAKTMNWPTPEHAVALTRFFGDESWRSLYSQSGTRVVREGGDRAIIKCYEQRLKSVFKRVVDPERTLGSADDGSLFTLLFGAANPRGADVAARIAEGVFKSATGVQGRMLL